MEGQNPRYSVFTPSELLAQLRRWGREAAALGLKAEYTSALKALDRRLEEDPHAWGDHLKSYKHIDAVEYRGMIVGWMLVWYGVEEPTKTVMVRALLPAPGSPLSTPQG